MNRMDVPKEHGARARGLVVASIDAAADIPPTWRVRLRHVGGLFRVIGLGILAAGLAGLWAGCRVTPPIGHDVLLLIDVSQSMRARDAESDRLGIVLRLARALVAIRPRDRFGIVLFAGEHVIACPMTADHHAVLSRLSAVQAGLGSGTALGPAMLGTLARFPRGTGVLLVASDGVTDVDEPTPVEAALRLRASGVRVVTAGVGRPGLSTFATDMGVIETQVEADPAMLRSVAAAGGGLFVRADAPGAAAALAQELDLIPGAASLPGRPSPPPWTAGLTLLLLAMELAFVTWIVGALA